MPFKKIDVEVELEKEFLRDPAFKEVWENSRMEFEILAKLTRLRNEKGLTQKELAEKMGKQQQTISKIEKREKSPTLTTLCNLANALDVDIELIPRKNTQNQIRL